MSTSRTRRPVHSALQRAAIAAEQRRCLLHDLPALAGLSVEQLTAVESALGEDAGLARSLDAACTSSLVEVGADAQVIDLLQAEARILAEAASTRTALDAGVAQRALDRIDLLAADASSTPAAELPALRATLGKEVEAFEATVVDAACEAELLQSVTEAASEALRRAGLVDVQIVTVAGEISVTARDEQGREAEIVVGSDAVEVTAEDEADRVHGRHEQAGEICTGAVEVVQRIHLELPEALATVGLGTDRLEAIGTPTRGAARRRTRKAARKDQERTAGGRS